MNLLDYLNWRGDIKISKEYKMNEVDALILSRFSYLPFHKIKLEEKETIGSISLKMSKLSSSSFLNPLDEKLICFLGDCERFKNLYVTDFEKITDKNSVKQFGAISIHLNAKEIFLSFIGTDNSINGWKEDLYMSFMDHVPCQITGREYLKKMSEKYETAKFYLGGHSKGGNVSLYSGLTSSKMIQKKILKIYNFDGPGFTKKITDQYETLSILKKIETFIPQDSIIGQILDHKEKVTVVLSNGKKIMEHDIYSWQVIGPSFSKIKQATDFSVNMDKTLTNWLEETSAEQRKVFIDTIFELFYSTDLSTFGEISNTWVESIPKILKKYTKISSEERKTITHMLKILVTTYLKTLKEYEGKKAKILKEKYLKKGKNKMEEMKENFLKKNLN